MAKEQGEFFQSPVEMLDLLEILHQLKEEGAMRITIHGSIVTGKGPNHDDIDLYVQFPKELIRRWDRMGIIACSIRRGRSGTCFDIYPDFKPFEQSPFNKEDKRNAVIILLVAKDEIIDVLRNRFVIHY